MYRVINDDGRIAKVWDVGVEIEPEAVQQIRNVMGLPFIHRWVSVMPDAHWGQGATIGSVIPTIGAIIPSAVGVDIGCGMIAARTSLVSGQLPKDRSRLRAEIEKVIPHGRTNNGGPGDKGAWPEGKAPHQVMETWNQYFSSEYQFMAERHGELSRANTMNHLGTLGGGNHFVEVSVDLEDRVWVVVHSGSRGIGAKIGSYFTKVAKREMKRWFVKLPDYDLAYLPSGTRLFDDYVMALNWALKYAKHSRNIMMNNAIGALIRQSVMRNIDVDPFIDCHHNYAAQEKHYGKLCWVTRKGAIRARVGDLGIIPGAMGARSFIVTGKGNRDSFMTCSHGAGRAMSRREARETFTLKDHRRFTEGLECRKDRDVLDETKGAYKDIDAVMAAQSDLVGVLHELRAVVCVKG